ncbi:hypothetical protein, partial [Desulfofundulus sp.]|uniref:hypothetical protein n=1 Tax=Desulfofundulus sp. TaxID=2282750 RepID=UPI003C7162F2
MFKRKTFTLTALVFLLVLFARGAGIAWALNLNGWVTDLPPTPQAYAGRVYTREHWTRFWYNEYGNTTNPIGDPNTQFIGGMYCAVFDLSDSDLSNGYTAITSQ